MFKRVFKRICLKIYLAGKHEYFLEQEERRIQHVKSNATIHPEAKLYDEAKLLNHQKDSGKIVIGKRSQIRAELLVFKHGGEIEIGDYTFIGEFSRVWSAKRIKIGNRVLISHNVNIHDNNSHPLDANERHLDFLHIFEKGLQSDIDLNEKEIIIEDDVWIGFNSTILKGVTIGKGAIVGAETLVTTDVPPYAVIVGNPARIVKYVN